MLSTKHSVIIDTNLWISFLLTKNFARPDQLFAHKQLTLLFSQELLPELKAPLNFEACFRSREVANLEEIDVPFIGFEELIVDKQANARAKDLLDIEQLRNKRSRPD